jgi:hypothetical protein
MHTYSYQPAVALEPWLDMKKTTSTPAYIHLKRMNVLYFVVKGTD